MALSGIEYLEQQVINLVIAMSKKAIWRPPTLNSGCFITDKVGKTVLEDTMSGYFRNTQLWAKLE